MNLLDKVIDAYYAVRFKIEDTVEAIKLKLGGDQGYNDYELEEPVKKTKKKKAKAKKKKK
jgi:hypothetical protein